MDGTGTEQIDLTRRAWDVVLRAQEEARALGDAAVGTDHVLLAMLGDGRGAGAWLLDELGVDYERVRGAIAGDPEDDAGPDQSDSSRTEPEPAGV